SYTPSLPITEQPNPITIDIDRANPKEIVQMLKKCDAEIFHRTLHKDSIYQVCVKTAQCTRMANKLSQDPEDSMIILSGCGTSGRIAFLLAAPFVEGQLNLCLNKLDIFTPVLIGFNPISMARTERMQDCPCHFKEVVERMNEMQNQQKAYLLNPVVGVWPFQTDNNSIYFSHILNEKCCSTSLFLFPSANLLLYLLNSGVLASIKINEKVHEITYSQIDKLATLPGFCVPSLQEEGRVCYLGWHSLGIIGIIDASECSPTFGAGISTDKCCIGRHFIIGHKDFVNTILPSLSNKDMILHSCLSHNYHSTIITAVCVRQNTSNLHALTHDLQGLCVPVSKITWLLSSKWCLNAISTGAHILKGKVYRNYMIDLRVSNSKLYKRAIHMLQRFTGSTHTQCKMALLRAIYDVEVLTDEIILADVTHHTLVAIKKDRVRVIPTALVMLQSGCTLAEARSHLGAFPVIRNAVAACLGLL
uniref:Glucokinase (hexokinase 4) regulator n=1 Tax=Electrophorus electricus TaxID=8005 RepID=A0A4W4F8M6_ELEEL